MKTRVSFLHTRPNEEEPAKCRKLGAAAMSLVGILPLGSAFLVKRERTGTSEAGI